MGRTTSQLKPYQVLRLERCSHVTVGQHLRPNRRQPASQNEKVLDLSALTSAGSAPLNALRAVTSAPDLT